MGCLGVHFALSKSEVDALKSLPDNQSRLSHLQEVIEEEYFADHPELMAENDKAWDAMHRSLADGKLTWEGGKYPLNHAVLGGELLYTDDDYIMSLKTPRQVVDVAAELPNITKLEFQKRYFAIDASEYGFPLSEEDFEYTWDYFSGVKELFIKAVEQNRFVLFTASQ